MAAKEISFSFEIILNAVLTHENGTTKDVEDTESIVDIFKDFPLVEKHFKEEDYFHLQKVSCKEGCVLLQCYVFSEAEVNALHNSIKTGILAKKLTDYACQHGLEITFGVQPGANKVQLAFELEDLTKKDLRQGIAFFKSKEKEEAASTTKHRTVLNIHKDEKGKSGSSTVKLVVEAKDEKVTDVDELSSIKSTLTKAEATSCKRQVTSDMKDNGCNQKRKTGSDGIMDTPVGRNDVHNSTTNQGLPQGKDKNIDSLTSTSGVDSNVDQHKLTKMQKANDNSSSTSDVSRSSTGAVLGIKESTTYHGSQTKTRLSENKPCISNVATQAEVMNLQSEVIVHIPPSEIKKRNIDRVFVEFQDIRRHLGYFEMTPCIGNTWTTSTIQFAPDTEGLLFKIRIQYHWKLSSWFSSEKAYSWTPMGSASPFRDILGQFGHEEGFSEHLMHMLLYTTFYGLKEAIMQADELSRFFFSRYRNTDNVLNYLHSFIEEKGLDLPLESFTLLGYIYGRIETPANLIRSKWLSANICQTILKSLKTASSDDLPSKTMPVFERIANILCNIAFPDNTCPFFCLVNFCSPFFGREYFTKQWDKYIQTGMSFLEDDFEYIQSVLKSFLKCFPLEDDTSVDFVSKLARHLPLKLVVKEESMLTSYLTDGSYEQILSTRVKMECRAVEKKKDIERLLELQNVLFGLNTAEVNFVSVIEQTVTCVLDNTPKSSHIEMKTLTEILKSRFLFVDTSPRESVMKSLAMSNHRGLHSLYVDLLSCNYLERSSKDFLLELTLTWFKKAVNSHCADTRYVREIDDLPHVYRHLNNVLSAQCVSVNSDLVHSLKARALKFLMKIDVKTLMDNIFESDFLEKIGEQEILHDHLQQHLFQGKMTDTLYTVIASAGSSSWSTWTINTGYTRLYGDIVGKALELSDLQNVQNDDESFLLMLRCAEFWIKVIPLCEHTESLKENKVLRKARTVAFNIGTRLITGAISLSFSKELCASLKDRDKAVQLILTTTTKFSKAEIKEAVSNLNKASEMVRDDYNLLSSTIDRLGNACGTAIQDLKDALKMIEWFETEIELGTPNISTVFDRSFWKCLSSSISCCDKISAVAASESFWKLCVPVVNQWLSHQEEMHPGPPISPMEDICFLYGEEKVKDKDPTMTLKVIQLLAVEGLEKYEAAWKPLLKGMDENSGTIGSLSPLLDVGNIEEEITVAEKFLGRNLPESVKTAFYLYNHYYQYSEKIDTIRKILRIFHLEDIDKKLSDSIKAFAALEKNVTDLSLKQLYESGEVIGSINSIVNEELQNILKELSQSSLLVKFLQDIALEDLRNLIDAVEEHAEQSVQESTVSALIDVKQFLSPVLRDPSQKVLEQVLRSLKRSLEESKITNLDQKINECKTNLHGLKALFHNVANRAEVTKEIVQKAVQSGSKFVLTLSHSKLCYIKLTYKSHNKTKTHTEADVKDLRSRVLLMVSTEAKDKGTFKKQEKLKEALEKFKKLVDDAISIASILTQLCQSGHPDFSVGLKVTYYTTDLELAFTELKQKLDDWQTALAETRDEYYWLNFFYPDQLRKIADYFKSLKKTEESEICSLLSFTGCDLGSSLTKGKDVYSVVMKEDTPDKFGLNSIGRTLDLLFQDTIYVPKPFPISKKADTKSSRIVDAVQEGQLFIAGLTENSDLILPTLMALYRNTTECLPKSFQVLFCQENSVWEDIELFLRRCFGSYKLDEKKQLFTLVCVERLSSEIQFRLVDALENMSESSVCLAVICRGGAHHSFLDHFSENVHHVQHMSQSAMEACLQTLWPNVLTVTSDVPGQGKSEFVNEVAWSKGINISSLHLSGHVTSQDLVKKLHHINMSSSHLLHIDIGVLSNPKDVDLLLFQLIVLGSVSHGSDMVTLSTSNICIEVANTISNTLRNSLNTVMNFRREILKWENYKNFQSSQEICSPVQVVCHYLDEYESGKLDSSDLYFSGAKACMPFPEEKCRALLRKHFSVASDMSFSVVHTFLNVLSDQLKKFSCSYFFRTTNISGMLGGDAQLKNVKSHLFWALLDVSREFATRSVNACRDEQSSSVATMSLSSDLNQSMENLATTSASASAMTQRVESMIQWAESNHLILAFHNQDIQTLSALYRRKDDVPQHIKKLFETQIKTAMPDFSKLSQKDLQEMLQRIARFKSGTASADLMKHIATSYALTPDNLLKMILIILRTRSHVPVIIMGETGCGKTSLIRYLSNVCGIQLEILNIHAGIGEEQIYQCVFDVNEKALKLLDDVVWLFLDEINTCDHLGLINTILCHHRCHGKALAPNLVVMAACNPYKIRTDKSIFTAGLQTKVRADEKSRLVYRVNPLPESMVDFVWDYGSLDANDEKAYIRCMIDQSVHADLVDCVIDLLVISQKFIRDREESGSCVSLRDVNRCKKLIEWFKVTLKTKYDMEAKCYLSSKVLDIRAVVLALAHSYHSRLPDAESRKMYRQVLEKVFSVHSVDETHESIFRIIQEEQSDILTRMELPLGTAKNTALQENVFVILVCILNHIPVFVVGKPGCSKSLSLQLIKSNLRGKDSNDPYFQCLPQVFCISYQGSESSTSDGIIKVFAKAKRYRELDNDDSALPVVILDEIGLAETSRFNPLKVLHSLLEPGDREFPEVAVVGISNWALDAAKMNRAIHLSRPDMDADELFRTGISISEASALDTQKKTSLSSSSPLKQTERKLDENLIRAIADAYIQYTEKQTFKNFHGLRDFYSLIKFISREFSSSDNESVSQDKQLSIIMKGLLRNFGGHSSEIHSVLTIYREHLEHLLSVELPFQTKVMPSVLELVKGNIVDKTARHLLLSTRGESALSIVESLLVEMERKYVLILGSHFEEDLTDDYNYRILNQIILCMEQGMVLILKDLESIYGSLYDMLNQNYTIVGSKKNCRIALGAYSNPLCHVHGDFRCIVLVEEDKMDLSDPPFLNRFEKQYLKLADLLSQEEKQAVFEIDDWIDQIAHIEGFSFGRSDMIPIDSPDMTASLVSFVFSKLKKDLNYTQKLEACKELLLKTCSPDSLVRVERSGFPIHHVQKLQEDYCKLPLHSGLEFFLNRRFQEDNTCLKEMIFTHSNLHVNVGECMKTDVSNCQIEKLGAFKSEKQLYQRISSFWVDSSQTWLIIQCSPNADKNNILLMKSIVDKEHKEFTLATANSSCKHVVIIMHLNRNEEGNSLGLVNFLSGWNMSFIDSLEKQKHTLGDFLHQPKIHLIQERRPLTLFLKQHLFWAFTLIHYHDIPRDLNSLKKIVHYLSNDEYLMLFLEDRVSSTLSEEVESDDSCNWQVDVACDRLKLYTHLTLHEALEHEITDYIRHPLAAIVYRIEEACSWDAVTIWCDPCEDSKRDVWTMFTKDHTLIDLLSVPPPEGPECYHIMDSVLSLKCPYSKHFIERIETLREPFMEVLRGEYPDFDIDEITNEIITILAARFQDSVGQAAFDMFENSYGEEHFSDYFSDVCNVLFSGIRLQMTEEDRTKVTEWSVSSRFFREGISFQASVCQLHITCWLYGTIIECELRLIDACLNLTDMQLDDILAFPDSLEIISEVQNMPATVGEKMNGTYLATKGEDDVKDDDPKGEDDVKADVLIQSEDCDEKHQTMKESVEDECHQENAEEPGNNQCMGENLGNQNEVDKESTVEHHGNCEVTPDYIQYLGKQDDKSTALVDFACYHLLPTESLLFKLQNNGWINGVSLVLSLASGVSFDSKVFQSLRMCSDFSNLIVTPFKLSQSCICNIGEALKKNSLESEYVFHTVHQLINSLLENVPCDALQHFFSCYISSALAADTESQLLQWTFKVLPTFAVFKETYSFFGSTLLQTLLVEVGSADIFEEENILEESEVLQDLEDCISGFKDRGEPDSQLACIVLDILQIHFCNLDFKLNSETIEKTLKYGNIFKSGGISLNHFIALAYLKNFLVFFSKELSTKDLLDVNMTQKLNGLLSIDESEHESIQNARTTSLQIFFLKVISQNTGVKRLEEIVSDYSHNLPFVTAYEMNEDHRFLALELCPFEMAFPDLYRKIVDAYNALQKDSSGKQVKTMFEMSKSVPDFMYCLFGVALQQIYVIQTVRQLTDSERNDKVKVFYEFVSSQLPENQQMMFRNLCAIGDFRFQLLQPQPNKTPEEHHMAICIIHLLSTVLAYNPNYGIASQKSPYLLRCTQIPKDLKKMFVPGSGFKESGLHCSTLLSVRTAKEQYAKLSCSCKCLTVIENPNMPDMLSCDSCKQSFQQSGGPFQISALGMDIKGVQGYAFIDIGCLQSEFTTVRRMSPASFRILQFILHSCLAGSLALEFTEEPELAKALNLPGSVDVASYINNHLHVHWGALKHLTEMGDSQLAKLFNFIIKDRSSCIARDGVQYESVEQQEAFERHFTTYINGVMKRRFQIVQDEVRSYQALHPTSPYAQFELKLAEIQVDENKLGYLPRLLREHVHPSEKNMQREFTLQIQVQEYPIMSLVFEKMKELSLLQYLMPLVQWHKCIIQYGSHRLKRSGCKQTVQDFVHSSSAQNLHGDKKSELQNRFDAFRRSWNALKENSDMLRGYNSQLLEMEHVNSFTLLEDCVIMTRHSNLMQVLVALQSIQNTFLVDAAAISLATKNLSTTFFRKSEQMSVIPKVHMEHLRRKQVVSRPDLKNALKFSQINTDFGHGQERQYDMYQIEAQVVDECLLSKPIIQITSSFPMISFSGESLHKTDELFESVIKVVGHECVDKDLKNSILQLKEKSASYMQTLLDYLQMTFSLLKRAPVSGSDKTQYLSEFLFTWQSLFPLRVKEVDDLCSKVRLTQTIALYELVEDLVADVIFDGLEEKFKQEMPEDCVNHMNGLVSNSSIRFQEALMSALKKIVFRYVQSGHANPEDKLTPFLMEKTLWPHGVFEEAVAKSTYPTAGLLHKYHLVEHIHSTIVFLAEAVMEKKNKEEKKSRPFQPGQRKQIRTQQRKKTAAKFRR